MKKPKGFMIYTDDWAGLAEDLTDQELGQLFKALITYFTTGALTDFTDRGMRQFYRQAIRWINFDMERYGKRCLKNAYNRYRGQCKQEDTEPLPYEDWLAEHDELLTTVDDGQGSLTMVTNTNIQLPITNSSSNDQLPISNYNPNDTDADASSSATKASSKKKKPPAPPTREEVRAYCRERNNNVDPDQFYDYYEANDWHDQDGSPVLSWKQKMIAVWEGKKRGRTDHNSGNNNPKTSKIYEIRTI